MESPQWMGWKIMIISNWKAFKLISKSLNLSKWFIPSHFIYIYIYVLWQYVLLVDFNLNVSFYHNYELIENSLKMEFGFGEIMWFLTLRNDFVKAMDFSWGYKEIMICRCISFGCKRMGSLGVFHRKSQVHLDILVAMAM